MNEHLDLQRTHFDRGNTRPISYRIKQLKLLKKVLTKNEHLLTESIYLDFKKSAFDTITTELTLLYSDIDEAIANVKRWASVQPKKTNFINFPARSYVIPEPLGVSLVIGAWNYPYLLSFAPAIAAIAAGCCVILKPSEIPAHSSKAIASIVNDHFDPGFFKVVEGGVPDTTALLELPFDKIFFTGSVPVGKIVYQAAAKNLVPVTLELGGKSPAIIDEQCNLKTSIKRLIWAKYVNAGQTCIAPDYVLIHSSIYDQALAQMKVELARQQFNIANDNYVQIVNKQNYDRLYKLIDQDKLVHGGTCDKEARTISPTILSRVTVDDACMQEEIFGPILPLIPYQTLDEAIAIIKSKPKPLACYVFTKNRKTKKRIVEEVSFGGGAVNDAVMHITNGHLPFGGVGHSGIGSYHGQSGFAAFSHYKAILDKPTWLELSLKYFPRTSIKLKLIRLVTKL
jgi:aldehyde dehydrogenase (NAD+)